MNVGRIMQKLAAAAGMVLMLAVVAGLALLDRWVPVPDVVAAPPIAVEVPAGRTQLVCTGPPANSSQDSGFSFDPDFDPGAAEISALVESFVLGRSGEAAPTGTYAPIEPGPPAAEPVAFTPPRALSAHLEVTEVAGPGLLEASPVAGVAALVAGATLARADSGDLRGLAAARCLESAASGWIVAGSTELGSSSRLIVDNAGATAATVRIEAWGALGPVELGQGASVLVPARSQRAVLLEAVAPDEPRLAVRLTVEGGQVAAFVQSSALEGFVPAGIDLSVPAAEPSLAVLVPGVVLVDTGIDASAPAKLRVVNPGAEAANVELRLLGTDGEMTIPGAERRVIEPGTVSDISLAGVPAGDYAAELVSDQPITAAAMLTRIGEPSKDDPDQSVVDRAWVPASAELPSALISLPSLGDRVSAARVVVTNPSDSDLAVELRTIEVSGRVGATQVLTVPARGTAVAEGDTLADAVGVELLAPAVAEGEQGTENPRRGFVVAAILTADVADGTLIAALSAQPDLEAARVVALRLADR